LGYDAGLWIRNREKSLNVSASVRIDSVIGSGPHYNVIGKLLGYKYPDKYVIVSSHYDTIMASGFCDNGAGTAGVLELARIFVEANSTGLFRPKYTMLLSRGQTKKCFLWGR
jgi:Zn-dependent M28 family amino/carboxypeptidase